MGDRVVLCPIDKCDWEYLSRDVQVSDLDLASVFGVGVMAAAAGYDRASKIEEALRRHLDSHTTLDWAQTVGRLRKIEEAARTLADHVNGPGVYHSDCAVDAFYVDELREALHGR